MDEERRKSINLRAYGFLGPDRRREAYVDGSGTVDPQERYEIVRMAAEEVERVCRLGIGLQGS